VCVLWCGVCVCVLFRVRRVKGLSLGEEQLLRSLELLYALLHGQV